MKISSSWGTGKTSRKRKRTVLRTKIRWDVLGLQSPGHIETARSMEDIRSQIISMASQGLGAHSRSGQKTAPPQSAAGITASTRKRKRGASQ